MLQINEFGALYIAIFCTYTNEFVHANDSGWKGLVDKLGQIKKA